MRRTQRTNRPISVLIEALTSIVSSLMSAVRCNILEQWERDKKIAFASVPASPLDEKGNVSCLHETHNTPSHLRLLALFILLLIQSQVTHAQTYPVQVTTSLIPPYTPELAHYSSAEVNNLQVFINVLELDRVDLRTKLRITIEGAGVKLTTSPGYVPQVLVLQGGVPTMLTGFDLRHYLNPDHMLFEGISRTAFMQTGQLPEGFYTFTVEVLDYNRGVRISNQAAANAWIVLNDPPLINFPFNGEKLKTTEPQTINFSWIGRHLASPNSAFSTEYEFALFEMYPGQTNPDVAVRSSNSIYRTTTTQTSLFYGPAEPMLTPGKKYAYRVRAYDISGRDLFKNQGYSETFWFQYGDACLPLQTIGGEVLDDSRIKVSWEAEPVHTGFEIQYREKGKDTWLTETALTTNKIIPDLKADTEYEYKVTGKCLQYFGEESTIRTLRTEASDAPTGNTEFSCGVDDDISDLSTVPLEQPLEAFDEFHIGGLDVIILEATLNGDGTYTGTGYAPLPMFKGAGLKVKINSVLINEDYHAIDGSVVTTYDKSGRFVADLDFGKKEDAADGAPEEEVDVADDPTDTLSQIASNTIATAEVQGDSIVLTDSTGAVVATARGGLPAEGETVTVQDEEGNSYVVDSNGNVTKGTGGGSGVTAPGGDGSDDGAGGLNFGPLVVELANDPTSTGKDEEGYCLFTDVPAKVRFTMEDSGFDPVEVEIPDALISYKKHCEEDKYKNVSLSYTNESGLPIGDISFIQGYLKKAELTVDTEGNLSGGITMSAGLTEDKSFKELFVIKKGISGEFSYSFSGGSDFSGSFNLSEVENIHIELRSSNQLLATMNDGVFNGSSFSGNFKLASGLVSFETDYVKSELKSLDIEASFDKSEGFEFVSGSSEIKFSEMKGVEGEVSLKLSYLNDDITAAIVSNQLAGFGMQFSDLKLSAKVNKAFELTELQGSLKAKHQDFDADLEVTDFLYDVNGLQAFSANGDVSYKALDFKIQDAKYTTDGVSAIELDAYVEIDSEGTQAVVKVTGFRISESGEITYDEINASAQSDVMLGPVAIKWNAEYKDTNGGKVNDKRTLQVSGEAEAILKTKNPKTGKESFKSIGKVNVEYWRYKEKDDGGLAKASLSWSGSSEFTNINGIDLTLKSLNLQIDDEEELSGSLSFDASLKENKVIKDVFILKKGLSGSVSYAYDGSKSFAGSFDFAGIKNLNVIAKKGDTEIAELKNGSFNGTVVSGQVMAKANASFKTNSFQVALDKLNLNVSYDLSSNDFTVNSGDGQLTVSDISGIEGSIQIGLEYGVDNNFNASIKQGTSLSGYGLTFTELALTADITSSFELVSVSGSVKAKHNDFNSALSITGFEVKNGSLTKFDASGAMKYRGFDFNLEKCNYKNSQLVLDAKLALNATGTESQFEVDNFKITNQGAVSLERVKGSLSKGNHIDVNFDIAMTENRFAGTFDGRLKSIGLGISGTLDIGKEQNYNFAYLKLSGSTNIPLGSTGLKLTEIGGQVGYNYLLELSNGTFVGSPKNGNYLLGLTLGVADAANMCEVVGTSVVQFSNSSFALSLEGQLNITRQNPIITSNLTAQYALPANSLKGSLNTKLQVPKNSGKYLDAQSNLNFGFADNDWTVNATSISGKFLSAMNFSGSFEYSGVISPLSVDRMKLQGTASLSFNKSYSASVGVASVDVDCKASINSNISAEINDQGLYGELSVNANGSVDFHFELAGFDLADVQATLDAHAKVKTSQTKLYIEGSQDFSFAGLEDSSVSLDFNYEHDL